VRWLWYSSCGRLFSIPTYRLQNWLSWQAATKVLGERRKRWKSFQSYISARARAQFSWMMSERAFKGRLRLEHSMRPPELIIEVESPFHQVLRVWMLTKSLGATWWWGHRKSWSEDPLWRRKVFLYDLSLAVLVGGHGFAHPLPRRIVR
jgi:hypothetical protein